LSDFLGITFATSVDEQIPSLRFVTLNVLTGAKRV